jgi:peroxiredoxin
MSFMQQFRTNWRSWLALALALGWVWASRAPLGSTTAGQIPAPQAGFLAPDFSLSTTSGQNVTLSNLRGQVVLVNIWATWCPPCQAEMPAMQRIYQEYQAQGFEILAVNSTAQDTLSKLEPFISKYALTFPVLLDEKGEVTRLYGVFSLPSSFFIGKDGLIHEVVIGGPMDEALLRARVEKLLQEQP